MRRMDRYNDEDTVIEKRSYKNKDLYQNVVSTKLTNINDISDVTNSNAFEIQSNNGETITSREKYHQMKKYQNVEPIPRVKKELDEFNYLYKNKEKKIYDINSVLEEARKNRKETDELEAKRKLKNTSYNILADLNKEELEKYREEKKLRSLENHEVTSELREIIDTITTKTLAGELDQETTVNLLSDLMATNILDIVKSPEEITEGIMDENIEEKEVDETTNDKETEETDEDIDAAIISVMIEEEVVEEPYIISIDDNEHSDIIEEAVVEQTTEMEAVKEIYDNIEENLASTKNLFNKTEINEAKEKEETENKEIDTDIASEFYTKDLMDESDEMSDDFKEKKLPLIVKILISLIIIAIIVATGYFIYLKLI